MRNVRMIPFPSRMVLQREERLFDRIRSVTLVGWLPQPRVRISTVAGGIDHRWLMDVRVALHHTPGEIGVFKFSQWRDGSLDDFIATLGVRCERRDVASKHLPSANHIAFVSEGHVRFFPLLAPA